MSCLERLSTVRWRSSVCNGHMTRRLNKPVKRISIWSGNGLRRHLSWTASHPFARQNATVPPTRLLAVAHAVSGFNVDRAG